MPLAGEAVGSFAALVGALPSMKAAVPSVLPPEHRREAARTLSASTLEWAAAAAYRGTLIAATRNADDLLFPFDDVRIASEDILVALLVELTGGDHQHLHVPGRPQTVVAARARGVSLDRITWTMRLLQRYWTERLLDHAARTGSSPLVIGDLALAIADIFDRFIDGLVRQHTADRAHERRVAAAERRRLVEALLAGRPADAEAIRRFLQVDIADHHVGVVVTTPPASVHERGNAVPFAEALEQAIPSAKVLTHPTVANETYLWLSCPQPPPSDRMLSVGRDSGLRIGIGSPHKGASGFRRTHLEGLDAERVARWSGKSLVHHQEMGVAGLAVADLERTRWFVTRHLGDLAVDTSAAHDLRQTLRSYLSNRMRLVDTSHELHLHRNSVSYRLRRINELLGYRPAERLAELSCALVLADAFRGETLRTTP